MTGAEGPEGDTGQRGPGDRAEQHGDHENSCFLSQAEGG